MAKNLSGEKKRGDAYQDAVAKVANTLYPNAIVEIGQWVDGPDGQRELDVTVRAQAGVSSEFIVIECKDWNRPIGIGAIDALESKRRDVGAKLMMICSNSGFTGEALRKAARVGIPALAALIEGDKRVRVVVREQIYTRTVQFVRSKVTFDHRNLPEADKAIIASARHAREFLYHGSPIEPWFATKWLPLVVAAARSRAVHMRFTFRQPIPVTVKGLQMDVTAIDLRAEFTVQWMTQEAEIGVSAGMYDYLKKRVVFGPGPHQFHLKNVNTKTWGRPVDLDQVPPRLLIPRHERSTGSEIPPAAEYLTLAMIKELPGGDPKNAPKLDPFLASEEVMDDVISTGV